MIDRASLKRDQGGLSVSWDKYQDLDLKVMNLITERNKIYDVQVLVDNRIHELEDRIKICEGRGAHDVDDLPTLASGEDDRSSPPRFSGSPGSPVKRKRPDCLESPVDSPGKKGKCIIS